MNPKIKIDTHAEFKLAVRKGFQPLIDWRFNMPIRLRVEIQREYFGRVAIGRGKLPSANDRFYHFVWNNKPHVCEESMIPLEQYNAAFISHIFTRGAWPEMAHDPRNANILISWAHRQWENGKRMGMRIYQENALKMQILKSEYQNLNV